MVVKMSMTRRAFVALSVSAAAMTLGGCTNDSVATGSATCPVSASSTGACYVAVKVTEFYPSGMETDPSKKETIELDERGRPVAIHHEALGEYSSISPSDYAFVYAEDGLSVEVAPVLDAASGDDVVYCLTNERDAEGRVAKQTFGAESERLPESNYAYVVESVYDDAGRIRVSTFGLEDTAVVGAVRASFFDEDGLCVLTAPIDGWRGTLQEFASWIVCERDAEGCIERTMISDPESGMVCTTSYERDAEGRAIALVTTDIAGEVLESYRFEHDADGNVSRYEDATGRGAEVEYQIVETPDPFVQAYSSLICTSTTHLP